MPTKKAQKKDKEITQAEKYRNLWSILAILLLTVLIYSNSLGNDFINFDDPESVTKNPFIRQINIDHLIHYFTNPVQFMYMPMAMISYAVDYQVGELDPFIYHLDNLLWHLGSVVLVFWVFRLLTGKSRIALFVTALFAIHPVNVDSVSWIATRPNLVATFFYLLALLCYSFYIQKNFQLRYLVLTCLAFIFSALSKSSAVVLPLTLFLWDYFYERKWDKKLLLEKIPFFVVALFFGILTLTMRTDAARSVQYDLFDRLFIFCYALVDYFVRLLFPLQLSMSYAYPAKDGLFLPPQFYLAPFILGLIVWGLYKLKGSRKILIVGLSFFFLNVLLSQSVLLIDNFMASRYVYLSYLGLFLILADFNERVLNASLSGWQSRLKTAWIAALVVFAIGFAVLTYNRNFVWKNTITLFDDVIQKQPTIAWAYGIRGVEKLKYDLDDARKDLDQSLALDPDYSYSLYYRGVVNYLSDDYPAALVDLDKALVNDPRLWDAWRTRGKVKIALKDHQGALRDLNQALALDKYSVEAYYYRGISKNSLGDYQGAIADFDMAISYAPNYAEAFYMRSLARLNLNDLAGSCADAATGLALGYRPTPDQVNKNCP